MLKQIKEDELLLYETFFNPIACTETFFSNLDNLTECSEDKFSEVRLYQIPLFSFEYIFRKPVDWAKKEWGRFMERAGRVISYMARNTGKTLICSKLDMIFSLCLSNLPMLFTAFDEDHVKKPLVKVKEVLDFHPFFKFFKQGANMTSMSLQSKTGAYINGINMTLQSTDPGKGFFGEHVKKMIVEEASKETQEVYEKRLESRHDLFCIERVSGMADYTRHSPAGKTVRRDENKPYLLSLPQFVSNRWDEEERRRAILKYGDEHNPFYQMYVLGQEVGDTLAVFDMQRVDSCKIKNKEVKTFGLDKEEYILYKDYLDKILIVHRPENAQRMLICMDVGDSARGNTTEIGIFAERKKQSTVKYRLLYNIVLGGLTGKEQYKIVKYLAERINAEIIGVDCGEGVGRNIVERLSDDGYSNNICRYRGTENVIIGFEKNHETEEFIIDKSGNPTEKKENMKEWAVQRLREMFEFQVLEIPQCNKFDKQISSVVAVRSGKRTIYDCPGSDHFFSMMLVFSITQWEFQELVNLKPITRQKNYYGPLEEGEINE